MGQNELQTGLDARGNVSNVNAARVVDDVHQHGHPGTIVGDVETAILGRHLRAGEIEQSLSSIGIAVGCF